MNFCVSMTSVPPRFSSLEKTLNSLNNQKKKPNKIFLNIPSKFKRFKNIKYNFNILTKKFTNLIINRCNDYGPGTKLLGSLDQTTYKGKTYTASRICPVGKNMYWQKESGFMRKTKISELGCMTKAENEEYWRQYNLQKAGAPRVTGGGSGWKSNNQAQQNRMRIQTNEYKQYLKDYSRDMGWE